AVGHHDEPGEADGAGAHRIEFTGPAGAVPEPDPLTDVIGYAHGHPAWPPEGAIGHADAARTAAGPRPAGQPSASRADPEGQGSLSSARQAVHSRSAVAARTARRAAEEGR